MVSDYLNERNIQVNPVYIYNSSLKKSSVDQSILRTQMMSVEITERVKQILGPCGYETYPFKIGWYNDHVQTGFKFPYDYDTLSILIVSTPDMFDKSLVPYMKRNECPGSGDMLDKCITEHFATVKQSFPDYDVEAIHDFEMLPSRRPKVLVQTAGHISGAAYYYQRSDIQSDAWPSDKRIYGVSIHPKYGGWFALRGVLIFKKIQCPDLVRKDPLDVVQTREKKIELLERFNNNWQDWTYRDIIPVEKKYSELQKQYFSTLPKDRQELIQKLKCEYPKT